jgi:hypothetical protein
MIASVISQSVFLFINITSAFIKPPEVLRGISSKISQLASSSAVSPSWFSAHQTMHRFLVYFTIMPCIFHYPNIQFSKYNLVVFITWNNQNFDLLCRISGQSKFRFLQTKYLQFLFHILFLIQILKIAIPITIRLFY